MKSFRESITQSHLHKTSINWKSLFNAISGEEYFLWLALSAYILCDLWVYLSRWVNTDLFATIGLIGISALLTLRVIKLALIPIIAGTPSDHKVGMLIIPTVTKWSSTTCYIGKAFVNLLKNTLHANVCHVINSTNDFIQRLNNM